MAEGEKYARKEILLKKSLVGRAAPFVTAKAWAIFDVETSKCLFGKAEAE